MNETVASFVEGVLADERPLRSILSYPHPFTPGGVILVGEDDDPDWLGLIGRVHAILPPGLSLYCLRQQELFQLSLPGLFAPPFVVNERPFLPHWLQHKGRVWWGEDVRPLVKPTVEPRFFLAGHLEGCRDALRRYGILPALLRQKYDSLWGMLQQEMLRLMGTAVLLHNHWDIDTITLPDLFDRLFPDESLWTEFNEQQQRPVENPEAAAYHAVWLFETFTRRLEAYT